ncbi:MAG: LysR family transcriptional regulator [Myxococcota bacterium]
MSHLRPGDVELLKALYSVGSTAEGARVLGVEQSTVSRRLARVEERFGRDLFVRTASGLIPTPFGERLRPLIGEAQGALARADALIEASQSEVSGSVRLALPEAFAHHIVVPRLGELQRQHPRLELVLDDGPDLVDLQRAEAHIAVRVPRPRAGNVVVKRYLTDTLALYGAPDYVRARAFEELTLLGWDDRLDHLGEARLLTRYPLRPDLRFCRMTTMLAAAMNGLGVALIGSLMAREVGLVRADAPVEMPEGGAVLWLAAPTSLRDTPAVDAVWRFLEGIADEARRSLPT